MVLGAGVAGLTAAEWLSEGGSRVLVLDEFDHLGGNQRSFDFGSYTFDVGAIVFHDHAIQFRLFPGLLDVCHETPTRVGKLNPAGNFARYPLDLKRDLMDGGVGYVMRTGAEIAWSRLTAAAPRNAAEFGTWALGPSFFEASGLRNYIEEFNHAPADDVDMEFVRYRMNAIRRQASPGHFARQACKAAVGRRGPRLRSFVRPKSGFETYYRVIRDSLTARGVSFSTGCRMSRITRDADGRFSVESSSGRFSASRVVSTIPLGRVGELIGLSPCPARYVGLTTLFV
ncbi:MAG: FAD-dependent oxidoreductase, partial [Planctomycetota bacterium]